MLFHSPKSIVIRESKVPLVYLHTIHHFSAENFSKVKMDWVISTFNPILSVAPRKLLFIFVCLLGSYAFINFDSILHPVRLFGYVRYLIMIMISSLYVNSGMYVYSGNITFLCIANLGINFFSYACSKCLICICEAATTFSKVM